MSKDKKDIDIEQIIEENLLPLLTQETCKILNQSQTELSKINWSSGESNLDKGFSELSRKCCIKAFNKINRFKELKLEVDIPDLKLTFITKNKKIKRKIELKSTKSKNGKLPGSMIMSLDLNTWTIFCHRVVENFQVRYGRYHIGMTRSDHEMFQDRSPRPDLHFAKFQKPSESPKTKKIIIDKAFWKSYAKSAIRRILEPKSHSWQDDLVKEIIKEVLKDPKKFKDV